VTDKATPHPSREHAVGALLLKKGKISREQLAQALEEGMVTLKQDGYRLVLSGDTSLEEIRRVAGNGR